MTPPDPKQTVAHTLAEQLSALRAQRGLVREVRATVELLPARPRNDQSDIDAMLEADAWSPSC